MTIADQPANGGGHDSGNGTQPRQSGLPIGATHEVAPPRQDPPRQDPPPQDPPPQDPPRQDQQETIQGPLKAVPCAKAYARCAALTLAYFGDAVIELFAREAVLAQSLEPAQSLALAQSIEKTKEPDGCCGGKSALQPHATQAGEFTNKAKRFVTCEAQSDAVQRILPALTEEEIRIYKRGRNAKSKHVPRHGELIQYRRATGLEALFGYLYLSGQVARAKQLFHLAYGVEL